MPYLKISRDKRGYETYYLLEPAPDRSNQTRPRILFWFRTPPQVKVGREPFSEEIRQAIESQHPDLRFDWPRLMAMQPPPLDIQRWRERRRLERAARRAAREEPERGRETNGARDAENGSEELPIDDVDTPRHSIEAAVAADAPPAVPVGSSSDPGEASPGPSRRRRRRRGGRRQGSAQADGTAPQPPPAELPPSSDEV